MSVTHLDLHISFIWKQFVLVLQRNYFYDYKVSLDLSVAPPSSSLYSLESVIFTSIDSLSLFNSVLSLKKIWHCFKCILLPSPYPNFHRHTFPRESLSLLTVQLLLLLFCLSVPQLRLQASDISLIIINFQSSLM